MQASFVERDRDFIIYANSTDNLSNNPGNKFYDFILTLPKTIWLKQEKHAYWTLQLIDAALLGTDNTLIPIPESVVILSDIIESSIIKGEFYPILKHIWKEDAGHQANLFTPVQIPLIVHTLNTFRIKVLNDKLEPLNLDLWENLTQDWTTLALSFVLHFQLMEIVH